MKNKFRGKRIFLIPFFVAAFLALFSFFVMTLWNNVLVPVVHVSAVSFWQALGILVLSKILFGGFRGAHWGRHRFGHAMQQRWMNMSPEDKEKFREEWKKRCGRRFPDEKPAEQDNH